VPGRSAKDLLDLPISLRGIELGRPVDLLLDLPGGRALGVEVRCGDGARRFLAAHAATLANDAIRVSSPLALVDEAEADFYRRHGAGLSGLLGARVEHATGEGVLDDVCVDERMQITSVVVAAGGERLSVPLDDDVRVRLPHAAAPRVPD
jgi:hypothetical protein